MARTDGTETDLVTAPPAGPARPAATPDGHAADALFASLAERPWRFDFFEALRRLECVHRDQPRWGESDHLAEDPVRLAQEPSLAFATSTLGSFVPGHAARVARLEVLFFGLFGPNGPLPLHLTDHARDRIRSAGDPTFARFADVFHHRLIALFYRAWATAKPAVQRDRPESDRFAAWVGSLFGMGTRTLWPTVLPATALLHHAGLMAAPSRHADGLAGMLTDFLGVPARIESFVGHWIELPRDASCRLGGAASCAALGRTAIVGTRVWDCQHKFRVVLGPLDYEDYGRLLPGGETLARLRAMVKAYVGEELAWDVNVTLKQEQVPPLELGGQGRLGWTSWIHGGHATHDAADLVLNPLARAA